MNLSFKTYLGDGVYIGFDGFSVVLTTENGIETTNTIYLEPDTLAAFLSFTDSLRVTKVNLDGR